MKESSLQIGPMTVHLVTTRVRMSANCGEAEIHYLSKVPQLAENARSVQPAQQSPCIFESVLLGEDGFVKRSCIEEGDLGVKAMKVMAKCTWLVQTNRCWLCSAE